MCSSILLLLDEIRRPSKKRKVFKKWLICICYVYKLYSINTQEEEEKKVSIQTAETHTDDYKRSEGIVEDEVGVIRMYTNRFEVKRWLVNGELPCPECNQWVSASNFARHAKQHDTTTQKIFTDERYMEKINEMIQERTAEK
ncbi:hypothetical protein [Bacillus lumedeiriae]|uniref:hypothetical protein n=1 Tax=Bacillus lumedeiriae TaxID=3058829 RepID=UPI00384E8EBB